MRVATMSAKGSRFVVTVDGVEGPPFDEILNAAGDLEVRYDFNLQPVRAHKWQGPVAFSPDGRSVAAMARHGQQGRSLYVNGEFISHRELPVVTLMSFTPDSRHVLTVSNDQGPRGGSNVRTYRLNGEQVAQFAMRGMNWANAPQDCKVWEPQPDGSYLFVGPAPTADQSYGPMMRVRVLPVSEESNIDTWITSVRLAREMAIAEAEAAKAKVEAERLAAIEARKLAAEEAAAARKLAAEEAAGTRKMAAEDAAAARAKARAEAEAARKAQRANPWRLLPHERRPAPKPRPRAKRNAQTHGASKRVRADPPTASSYPSQRSVPIGTERWLGVRGVSIATSLTGKCSSRKCELWIGAGRASIAAGMVRRAVCIGAGRVQLGAVRPVPTILLIFAAAGCSRPPSAETFTAEPLASSFVALHSPNGQRQVLLVRAGSRWHGHLDDTFAATVRSVVAEAGDGTPLDVVHPTDAAEPPVEIAGWRSIREAPPVIVEAWAAGDPALRAGGPSSLVSMLRLAGDPQSIAAVNAALAAAIEGAVGLVSPPGDTLEDPGAIAARVAVEAAIQAVVDEDSGEANPGARVAVLQIPVLLNRRFLAVEHLLFEDSGAGDGGAATSRFTLHDLETGGSPDMDATLDATTRANLFAIAGVPAAAAEWYPARPGIALVYRDAHGAGIRRVVPWRNALPLLPADSPLRAVAESVR